MPSADKKEEKARRQLEKFAVSKDEEGGEGDEEDDMGGTRNRFNRRFQQKNQASDEAEKPKYDKNVDFFDSITNSSLEQKRGGYRGRGRGNRDFRGEDAFGRRDNRDFRDRDNYE